MTDALRRAAQALIDYEDAGPDDGRGGWLSWEEKFMALRAALAAADEYERKNPLGGPASVFRAAAERIEAGEDYDEVLADYGLAHVDERAALAAPQAEQPEVVARFDESLGKLVLLPRAPMLGDGQLVYATPPTRKPLTDEEIGKMALEAGFEMLRPLNLMVTKHSNGSWVVVGETVKVLARAIERAHGIVGGGE